jgi:hypothetical protein
VGFNELSCFVCCSANGLKGKCQVEQSFGLLLSCLDCKLLMLGQGKYALGHVSLTA